VLPGGAHLVVDRMIVGDVAFSNLIWGQAACLAESLATA
jgi:hypothetical protein